MSDNDQDERPVPIRTQVSTPAELSVMLICPQCGLDVTIAARLFARVTKDTDGSGALAVKLKAPKAQHVCDQLSLGIVEGSRVK